MCLTNPKQPKYVSSHITGKVRKILEQCIRSAGREAPGGCIIEGPTGIGKTATCKNVQAQLNELAQKDGQLPPIYYVTSPVEPSTKNYYSEILSALGDHAPYSGTVSALRGRLFFQLEKKGVKVLIFDEFQQLIEKRSEKVVRQTMDDIKLLSDRFKIACVFVGTQGVSNLDNNNEQAASRYPYVLHLSYMGIDNKKRQKIFRKFIGSYIDANGIRISGITEYELMLRLYAATGGDFRLMIALLDDATGFITDVGNVKPITIEALKGTAKSMNVRLRKTKVNPFSASIKKIERELNVMDWSEEAEQNHE